MNCGCCKNLPNSGVKGYVRGETKITILDVLEILKKLSGMSGMLDSCENALRASLITEDSQISGKPTILDALEILKKLAGMPNLII